MKVGYVVSWKINVLNSFIITTSMYQWQRNAAWIFIKEIIQIKSFICVNAYTF